MSSERLILRKSAFGVLTRSYTNRAVQPQKIARGLKFRFMRQTTCLVFNPIMVEGYAALFSCTAVVQASDSMTASM